MKTRFLAGISLVCLAAAMLASPGDTGSPHTIINPSAYSIQLLTNNTQGQWQAGLNVNSNNAPFIYGSPTGFTNGGGAGAALAAGSTVTNNFGRRIWVELIVTNSIAAGEIGVYPQDNGVIRQPLFSSFAAALADTNTISFPLGPGGSFGITNLAGNTNVKTNEVQQW